MTQGIVCFGLAMMSFVEGILLAMITVSLFFITATLFWPEPALVILFNGTWLLTVVSLVGDWRLLSGSNPTYRMAQAGRPNRGRRARPSVAAQHPAAADRCAQAERRSGDRGQSMALTLLPALRASQSREGYAFRMTPNINPSQS
jgi:hypothetical protein